VKTGLDWSDAALTPTSWIFPDRPTADLIAKALAQSLAPFQLKSIIFDNGTAFAH
jgi:hypothetical protein